MGVDVTFSTVYPASLDGPTQLPDLDGSDNIRSNHVDTLALIVRALEAKVGADDSVVTSSLDYMLKKGRLTSKQAGGGGGSIAFILDTLNSHSGSDKLLQIKNTGTERAYVGPSGDLVIGVGGSGVLTLGSTDVTKRIIAAQGGGGDGEIRYNKDTDKWELSNNGGTFIPIAVDPSGGSITLDDAYDGGGAGAGRTITADSGAVAISNTVGDATNTLELVRTTGTGAALAVGSTTKIFGDGDVVIGASAMVGTEVLRVAGKFLGDGAGTFERGSGVAATDPGLAILDSGVAARNAGVPAFLVSDAVSDPTIAAIRFERVADAVSNKALLVELAHVPTTPVTDDVLAQISVWGKDLDPVPAQSIKEYARIRFKATVVTDNSHRCAIGFHTAVSGAISDTPTFTIDSGGLNTATDTFTFARTGVTVLKKSTSSTHGWLFNEVGGANVGIEARGYRAHSGASTAGTTATVVDRSFWSSPAGTATSGGGGTHYDSGALILNASVWTGAATDRKFLLYAEAPADGSVESNANPSRLDIEYAGYTLIQFQPRVAAPAAIPGVVMRSQANEGGYPQFEYRTVANIAALNPVVRYSDDDGQQHLVDVQGDGRICTQGGFLLSADSRFAVAGLSKNLRSVTADRTGVATAADAQYIGGGFRSIASCWENDASEIDRRFDIYTGVTTVIEGPTSPSARLVIDYETIRLTEFLPRYTVPISSTGDGLIQRTDSLDPTPETPGNIVFDNATNTVTRQSGSWFNLGLVLGGYVYIGLAEDTGNRGRFGPITGLTDTVMTIASASWTDNLDDDAATFSAAYGLPAVTWRAVKDFPSSGGWANIGSPIYAWEDNDGDRRLELTQNYLVLYAPSAASGSGFKIYNAQDGTQIMGLGGNNSRVQFATGVYGFEVYSSLTAGAIPLMKVRSAVANWGLDQYLIQATRDQSGTSPVWQLDGLGDVDMIGPTSTKTTPWVGPVLNLKHNDGASEANGDVVGWIAGYGQNNAPEEIEFGRIGIIAEDVTDGAEIGAIGMWASVGTPRRIAEFRPGNTAAEAGLILRNRVADGATPSFDLCAWNDIGVGNPVLRVRDYTSTTPATLFQVLGGGALQTASGSVSQAAHGFLSDDDTGGYLVATGEYGIVAAGKQASTFKPGVTYEPHDASGYPAAGRYTIRGVATTSNATPVNVTSFLLAANSAATVEIRVVARLGTSDSASYVRGAHVWRTSGVASIEGTVEDIWYRESTGVTGWAATIYVSGADGYVYGRITGPSSGTVLWEVTMTVDYIASAT